MIQIVHLVRYSVLINLRIYNDTQSGGILSWRNHWDILVYKEIKNTYT